MEYAETSESGEDLKGISLTDVFSIVYLGDDQVPPENQLGTISISERYEYNEMVIYKVDEVDVRKPSIKFGDPIMITGAPLTEIFGFDIEFDLFCGVFKGSIEGVEWEEPGDNRVFAFEEGVNSLDGTSQISVQYGLFTNATIANVEISLLGNNNNNTNTNVHGFVFASNSRVDSPTKSSILFWKNSDSKVQVIDSVIPLSKSLVGVPLYSKFTLAISLTCDNNQMHKTKLSMVVSEESFGERTECCDGNLLVQVTFKCRD